MVSQRTVVASPGIGAQLDRRLGFFVLLRSHDWPETNETMPILLKGLSLRLRVLICLTAASRGESASRSEPDRWFNSKPLLATSDPRITDGPRTANVASLQCEADAGDVCSSAVRLIPRASLTELSLLMNHCQGLVEAQVVFLQPLALPLDWSQTDLWEDAARIPGVTPRQDFDGAEHRLFHACISGEVFLYQPGGELAFHGGITASRGHAGDNQGRIRRLNRC